MLQWNKVMKNFVGNSILLFALSANGFADFTVVQDIKSDAEAAILSYLKDDPSCHSCRGNARSAGVHYLQMVRDNSNKNEFLRGNIWVNSCQDWGNGKLAYGSLDASPGQCGYTEVQFLLPIMKNAGIWSGNFSHITTDIGDHTQVQQVIPSTLFPTSFIQKIGVFAIQSDFNYPKLQIDIEQIFHRCAKYLD